MNLILERSKRNMPEDSAKALKEIAWIIKENSSAIISDWIYNYTSYNSSYLYQDYTGVLDVITNIINNYILYFKQGNLNGFYKANEMLVDNIDANCISYKMMRNAFQALEDSCSNIFKDRINPCDALDRIIKYQAIMSKTINELFYVFSEAFLKLKDTTIIALAKMAEYHEPETSKHLIRTREYAAFLAKELDLEEVIVKQIYKAGPLHDIGKIGISENILLKKGKLSQEEFEEMKRHTVIGGEIISQTIGNQSRPDYYTTAVDIAMYHHEWYDGSGYPKGLSEEQIPVSARIFAVADVYDALVSKRPYKDAIPHASAVKIIESESRHHFDPRIIKIFMKVQDKFLSIKNAYSFENME